MLGLVMAQNARQEVGKQDGVIMEVQLHGFVFLLPVAISCQLPTGDSHYLSLSFLGLLSLCFSHFSL